MENSLIVLKLISVVYLFVLLPVYIVYVKKHGRIESPKLKLALSVLFCAAGLIGATLNDFSLYSVFILLGLMASLAGDYFLIYLESDIRKYTTGILFFGLTHLFFLISMLIAGGFFLPNLFVSIVIYGVLLYYANKKNIDFGEVKYPLYAYSLLIVLMTVKALSMIYFSPYDMESSLLMALGASLFMASDIFLLIYEYMGGKYKFRILNSIAYFTGQLLIAASLFYT
jgi:uncharacterized membrane protein YhhN